MVCGGVMYRNPPAVLEPEVTAEFVYRSALQAGSTVVAHGKSVLSYSAERLAPTLLGVPFYFKQFRFCSKSSCIQREW